MLTRIFERVIGNAIVVALLVAVLLWLFIQLRYILALVLLSYILSVALLPLVRYLEERRLPRVLAVLIPYLALLGLIALAAVFLVPLVVSQFQNLAEDLPEYLGRFGDLVGGVPEEGMLRERIEASVSAALDDLARGTVALASQTFQIIVAVFALFVLSVYLTLDHDKFKQGFINLFPARRRPKVERTISEVERTMGAWLRGQVLVAFIVGSLIWIALEIAGIPFAFTLGITAGLFEFIPYIGPLAAAVPGVAVGLSESFFRAAIVGLIYMAVQALENNVILPLVMGRIVELHPVTVIIVILAGAVLMGVLGALLAIPVATIAKIIIQSLHRPEEG